jgi:hypothetical protein
MAKRALPFILMLVGTATSALAQDSLPAQLTKCLEIPGVLQRLACYDRVAHSVAPAYGARTPGTAVERPVLRTPPPLAYAAPPTAVIAPATGLGSERLPRAASDRRASEMVAGVASITFDPRGHFTVTLDNGQVWRQLEGDTGVLQKAGISTVRISRGALGSYDLNVEGRNATYRVMRLR